MGDPFRGNAYRRTVPFILPPAFENTVKAELLYHTLPHRSRVKKYNRVCVRNIKCANVKNKQKMIKFLLNLCALIFTFIRRQCIIRVFCDYSALISSLRNLQ